jgi:hypothetical protein
MLCQGLFLSLSLARSLFFMKYTSARVASTTQSHLTICIWLLKCACERLGVCVCVSVCVCVYESPDNMHLAFSSSSEVLNYTYTRLN